jgi:hypothetical protein
MRVVTIAVLFTELQIPALLATSIQRLSLLLSSACRYFYRSSVCRYFYPALVATSIQRLSLFGAIVFNQRFSLLLSTVAIAFAVALLFR